MMSVQLPSAPVAKKAGAILVLNVSKLFVQITTNSAAVIPGVKIIFMNAMIVVVVCVRIAVIT
jgi:hypothetical protein